MKSLLFLIVAFSIPAGASSEVCDGVLASMENAQRMMAQRGTERDRIFIENPHYTRVRVGMPSSLQLVSPVGKVFRHYTHADYLQRKLDSKTLRAGWTPFYYSASGMTDLNEDLTGIFITYPEVAPHHVGVRTEHKEYVDFKLNENTGVLFLREGILLIPGQARVESWKIRAYQEGGPVMRQLYAEEFERWDKEGIPQPLEIPIEIVDHSGK